MNTTNAKLEALVPVPLTDNEPVNRDEKVHFVFEADLVFEDWELFRESQAFMNDHMEEKSDMGDHMLALLTWAIHKAYEERTGKPFTLRMDRTKN